MSWPLSQDYNEAIQSPAANFADPELCRGQPVANALGIPMPRSGTFADVYQVRCPGGDFAVKCFTRQVPGLRERYAAIGKHLRSAALPFTVEFQYLPEGIRALGQWYPVVKMRWVEGLLLNQFVRANLDRPAALAALADVWLRMARRLRTSSVAHGDLQHANIILTPERDGASHAVRLIDYDGMWVTALAGRKSGEVGHPNYQHPQRLRDAAYGPAADRFPLLVIYCAVRGLILGGRGLWERYDNGDNLLFTAADLDRPRASALVWELARLDDPELRLLADSLSRAAYKPLDETPHLADLLADRQIPPSLDEQPADPVRKKVTTVALPPPSTPRGDPAPGEAKRSRVWLMPAAAGALTLLAAGAAVISLAVYLRGRKRPVTETAVARAAEVARAERDEPPRGTAADQDHDPPAAGQPAPKPGPNPDTKREPPSGPPEKPKPSPPLATNPGDQKGPGPRPAGPPEPKPPSGQAAPSKGAPAQDGPAPTPGPARPTVLRRFEGHTQSVLCVNLSPDGRRCLSGDRGGTLRLWDVEAGKELRSFDLVPSPIATLAFSGDGSVVYAAGPASGPVERPTAFRQAAWDSETGRVRHSTQHRRSADQGMPMLLAFSPGGKRFVVVESILTPPDPQFCQAEPLDFDDVKAGTRPLVDSGGAGATCVAVSPDGLKALTGGALGDVAVRLWDFERGTVERFGKSTTGADIRCVALSADMRYALTDHRGAGIQVWELKKGKVVRAGLLAGHTGAITCLALSPDGRLALSASRDRTVRLWDVPAGKELHRLEGHTDVVNALAFSPDGRRALTGGADRSVRLWALPPGKGVSTGPAEPRVEAK